MDVHLTVGPVSNGARFGATLSLHHQLHRFTIITHHQAGRRPAVLASVPSFFVLQLLPSDPQLQRAARTRRPGGRDM